MRRSSFAWWVSCVLASQLIASCGGMTPSSAHVPASATGGETASESITNVQEAGVDEGGIVKMHGEHLVVLRRGRLFSVDLSGGSMRTLGMADAFAPGQHPADWYDEMLIHDDAIVVIGFSNRDRASEIGLFSIDAAGRIAHRASFQLRSNDYYSARNYASRLIGDQLVLYVPHRIGSPRHVSYPALREVGHEWLDIEGPVHVTNPTNTRSNAVLHTVVLCDLSESALGCRAQGMLGAPGRAFYVSRDAVYVWIAEHVGADERDPHETDAVVYRLPLDGGATGAVRAWGMPTDQLSFNESEGNLHVLVRSDGGGDSMWNAEVGASRVALASIPVASFGPDARTVSPASYRAMPAFADGAPLQNRFVGDYVLYGTGDGWRAWGRRASEGAVWASSWRSVGPSYRIEVGHAVERIEVMGRAAVAIGSENGDLVFSAIALDGGPQYADRYRMQNASQGETRTHGFFFRNDGEGQGVLGLPVRGGNEGGWQQLRWGSASVQYLRVRGNRFAPLGGLGASELGQIEDRCVSSCVDWYGNARPIFFRGRVFALLGYELVEGRVSGERVDEVGRLSLWGGAPQM